MRRSNESVAKIKLSKFSKYSLFKFLFKIFPFYGSYFFFVFVLQKSLNQIFFIIIFSLVHWNKITRIIWKFQSLSSTIDRSARRISISVEIWVLFDVTRCCSTTMSRKYVSDDTRNARDRCTVSLSSTRFECTSQIIPAIRFNISLHRCWFRWI